MGWWKTRRINNIIKIGLIAVVVLIGLALLLVLCSCSKAGGEISTDADSAKEDETLNISDYNKFIEENRKDSDILLIRGAINDNSELFSNKGNNAIENYYSLYLDALYDNDLLNCGIKSSLITEELPEDFREGKAEFALVIEDNNGASYLVYCENPTSGFGINKVYLSGEMIYEEELSVE